MNKLAMYLNFRILAHLVCMLLGMYGIMLYGIMYGIML